MVTKARPPMIRPGGRSERIQIAVHQAVRELLAENAGDISIPQVAARAEVTPSTIYRRWRSLEELLAAVAAQAFQPDADLADTGTLKGDLEVWLANFVDDISTELGKRLLRERVTDVAIAQAAAGYAFENFETLVGRAELRGERGPTPDRLIDLLVAPVLYRIVFVGQAITKGYELALVASAIESRWTDELFDAQPSIGRLDNTRTE